MPAPTPLSDKLDFIVLAAGSGQRFGQDSTNSPKQFQKIHQKSVIAHNLDRLLSWHGCGQIILVLPADILSEITGAQTASSFADELASYGSAVQLVAGGESRVHSACNGLSKLEKNSHRASFVAIHDAARPDIPHAVLDRLKSALDAGHRAVIPVLPVSDTLRKIDPNSQSEHLSSAVINRTEYRRVQTPQAFDFELIFAAHDQIEHSDNPAQFTDDASLVEVFGERITSVLGDERLAKITYADDLTAMRQKMTIFETRTGSGFDVHKFSPDLSGPIMICGLAVESEKGLLAHSDGDVGLHALCDAIFGALGMGDIGQHFPPSDPQWKDASSDQFLRFAVDKVAQANGRIIHLDVTVICERPKIGPHRGKMIQKLSEMTGLAPQRLSVKATTTENLGFTGRGEGIAALAQATLQLPVIEG